MSSFQDLIFFAGCAGYRRQSPSSTARVGLVAESDLVLINHDKSPWDPKTWTPDLTVSRHFQTFSIREEVAEVAPKSTNRVIPGATERPGGTKWSNHRLYCAKLAGIRVRQHQDDLMDFQ